MSLSDLVGPDMNPIENLTRDVKMTVPGEQSSYPRTMAVTAAKQMGGFCLRKSLKNEI